MRVRNWFRRGPSDDELPAEVEAHLAMRADQEGESAASARRRFGNLLRTEEEMRGVWRGQFREALLQDARFTMRTWARNPGFTVAALTALALGLGAACGLFSMVDRILFRSLPYPDADRLVSVGLLAPIDTSELMLSGDYRQLWREPPAPFAAVTTVTAGTSTCDLTEADPERLTCAAVEWNLLRALGLEVVAGRDFQAADDRPGAARVALITHGLWMRRFGGDPTLAHARLVLDGEPIEVAGVLPRDFEMPTMSAPDVLLPQRLDAPMIVLRAFARLKPQVTTAQAQAALQPLFQQMLLNVPAAYRREVTLQVRSLRDRLMGDARQTAWLLMGAVGALLLIACTNVANLMLARMASRERELAVRVSLGASRGRLARLVLTESLLLALGGAAAGMLVAYGFLKLFVAIAPAGIPKLAQASLDLRVLSASMALAALTATLIGLWPSLAMTRVRALHGSRTIANVRPWGRFLLVSTQIALTFALVGGSTLLLRSLWKLQDVPLGFDTGGVVSTFLTLSPARYRTAADQAAFFEQLLDRARQIPGIQAAALSDSLPPVGATRSMIFSRIEVEGRPVTAEGTGGMAMWRAVTPGYFAALRIPIVRGRGFTEEDRRAPEPAVILSERLDRKLVPEGTALGKRIRAGTAEQPWCVVVGIARDVRNGGPAIDAGPEYYAVRRVGAADGQRRLFLVARTQMAPAVTIAHLRAEIARIDPELPVTFQTMTQRAGQLATRPRFIAWLLVSFAGIALVLAAMGLAGLAAFLVTQRTRDIGVRMALGATPAGIRASVLREAGSWVAAGTLFGLGLAWISARFLAGFLYAVSAWDPLTWMVALVVLSAALAAAVVRPAGRAARVDPMTALRSD